MIINPYVYSAQTSVGALTRYHRFYGDSISLDEADYAAAGHCLSGGGYTTRTATAKGIDGEWHALGSSTMWYHVGQVYSNTDIQSNESASYMGGLNNIRGESNTTILEGMLTGGLVAILGTHFAKTIRTPSTQFTQAGTGWSTNSSMWPKYSTLFIGSNNIGDTLTGTFDGDAFVLTSWYNNLGTYGYEVRVDGVLKKTVSVTNLSGTTTGGMLGEASPYGIVVSGCGAGSHTIVITIIAGSGTEYVFFDSLFELADFADPYIQPFVWLQIPRASNGYWGTDSPPFNNGSNTIVDNCNAAMETAISYFTGYSQFGIVRTNSYYNANDPAQGSTADGPYPLHPNCLGSQYIANAFNAITDSYVAPAQNALLTTWLASLVGAQPSASIIYNLNQALTFFDDAGVIASADLLHFFGGLATNEQRLLPIKTTGDSPITSTDTHNLVGMVGDGASTYTNLKWNPFSDGSNFQQNDASFFIYNAAASMTDRFLFGAWDGATAALALSPQALPSPAVYSSMHEGLYQFNGITITTGKGLWGMQRSGANSTILIQDGLEIASSASASVAVPNGEIYINALNSTAGPTAGYFYPGQVSFVLAGDSTIDRKRVDSIMKWYKRRGGF